MTPLKAHAKSRKITLSKLLALCETVLGFTPETIPEMLSDEQIAQIDAALAQAAEQVAALPPGGSTPGEEQIDAEPYETGSLIQRSPEEIEESRQVIEIMGEVDLRRHYAMFVANHLYHLEKLEQAHAERLFRFEQRVYSQTGETFQRMTRNISASYRDTERLLNPQTSEDHALYRECLRDIEDYLKR